MAEMSKAARDVLAERERQKTVEGWTAEHDDAHNLGEMADAAACYAIRSSRTTDDQAACAGRSIINRLWPWEMTWWKPTIRRSDLVKAGALILAEIERLDRLPPAPDRSA